MIQLHSTVAMRQDISERDPQHWNQSKPASGVHKYSTGTATSLSRVRMPVSAQCFREAAAVFKDSSEPISPFLRTCVYQVARVCPQEER
jgi:hypothetical protein